MVIVREAKKQEVYTPLAQFADRVIDLKTFFEGIKINFKRELTISLCVKGKAEKIIVDGVSPSNVIINNSYIMAKPNIGPVITIEFKTLKLSTITEVSNVSSIDYIFDLANVPNYFYRINVR